MTIGALVTPVNQYHAEGAAGGDGSLVNLGGRGIDHFEHRPTLGPNCVSPIRRVLPATVTDVGECGMSHTEDVLLVMSASGRSMTDAARGVLGSGDLVSNVSIATLMVLHRDGPQRPTRIAELTGLTSGGATKLITRLETAGLVTRETGAVPADGRAIVVSLTEFGSDKAEDVVAVVTPHVEAMIDALVAFRVDA